MKQTADELPADFCGAIDGVPVAELVARHGSPLFVFSEAALRKAARDARRAFRSRYPDVQFAWSYKTNYLKAVCAIFHQEGAIAEVVSEFEYEKARGMGVPGRDIIFNGPWKAPAILERAIDEGAKIQIDNFDELNALIALAARKGRTVEVALRVFMDTGARPTWSKFGFNAESGEALDAIGRINRSGCLKLVGLHTHVGTNVTDALVYAQATGTLIDLAELARREHGCNTRYLNLGGGFAGPSATAPSMDDYAEAICGTIHRRWPKDRQLPKLYLETGRALVDAAGHHITTIVALKESAYLVDSGIHLLNPDVLHDLGVRPARRTTGAWGERTLYGCLCMNTDVICRSVPLPELHAGDHLVLHPVGAYHISQAMQFIAYRPRVVMVREDGVVEVIREREDLRHLEAMERLPTHLHSPVAGQ